MKKRLHHDFSQYDIRVRLTPPKAVRPRWSKQRKDFVCPPWFEALSFEMSDTWISYRLKS